MDYKGQYLAEKLGMTLLILSAVAAYLIGHGYGEIKYTLYTFGVGTVLGMALVVPDYP